MLGPTTPVYKKGIDTFHVMKTSEGRFRYRITGEDYSKAWLQDLEAFRFKYGKSMSEDDIQKVEKLWEDKLIKELI